MVRDVVALVEVVVLVVVVVLGVVVSEGVTLAEFVSGRHLLQVKLVLTTNVYYLLDCY